MQALRDDNRIASIMGVSDVDGVTPTPIHCDPVTGRVLIEAVSVTDIGSINDSVVKRDENRKSTSYGTTDDVSLTAVPLIVDHRNNYLFVDLLAE